MELAETLQLKSDSGTAARRSHYIKNRKTFSNSVTLSLTKIVDFFKTQASPLASPRDGETPPTSPGGSKLVKSKTTDFGFKVKKDQKYITIPGSPKKSQSHHDGFSDSPRSQCFLRHTLTDVSEIRNKAYSTEQSKSNKTRYNRLKKIPSEPFLNSWDYHTYKVESTPECTPKLGLLRMESRSFLSPFGATPNFKRTYVNQMCDIISGNQIIFDTSKSMVKAGSVLAIFEWMIWREDTDREKIIQHAFLMSYTKYVTTTELLQKLLFVFDNHDTPQKIRASSLLRTWVEGYYYRYFANNDEIIQVLVYLITHHVASLSPMIATSLINFIAIQKIGVRRVPELHQVKNEFIDFNPLDLAQQLTLTDHKLFREIKPWEFLEAAVNSTTNQKDETSPRESTLVNGESFPNVRRFTKWFNTFSMWVAYEIVSTMNKKKRVEITKRFITLAKRLHEMNNFNSLMAVLSGLNMTPVRRLKQTWKKISRGKKFIEEAERIMAPYNNFNNYRVSLSTCGIPVVPLVVVHQRDLLFISDGNPSTVVRNNQKLLNFEKQVMISTCIDEMTRCQYVKYDYEDNPVIQNYLQQLILVDEKKLYKLSLDCEPPSREQP